MDGRTDDGWFGAKEATAAAATAATAHKAASRSRFELARARTGEMMGNRNFQLGDR